jgi:hypothetical protein
MTSRREDSILQAQQSRNLHLSFHSRLAINNPPRMRPTSRGASLLHTMDGELLAPSMSTQSPRNLRYSNEMAEDSVLGIISQPLL